MTLAAAGVELVTAPAEEVVSTSLTTGYASDSVFRGVDQGQNDAEAVLTTDISLPADINLTVDAAYSKMDSSVTDEEATELSAEFSKSVADYLISLSYTWNSNGYVGEGSPTQEIGISVQRAVGPVTVEFTQYIGLEGDNNGYSEVAALYSDDFGVLPVVLDFRTELGYLTQDATFTHFGAQISTDLPVVENVIARPFVAYNHQLGGEFASGVSSNDGFFGGVLFTRAF
jgi:hypothetical protein